MKQFTRFLKQKMIIPSESTVHDWTFSHASGNIYIRFLAPGSLADFSTVNQPRISQVRYLAERDILQIDAVIEDVHPNYMDCIRVLQFHHLNDAIISCRTKKGVHYVVRTPIQDSNAFMISDTYTTDTKDQILVTIDTDVSKVEIHDGLLG